MSDDVWHTALSNAPVTVKFFRINPLAKLPAYAHPGDSGMDLATPIDLVLEPGVPLFVDLGIACAIPTGYEGQIRSRSGGSKKAIIACSGVGTVDQTYRGSLGVVLLLAYQPPFFSEDVGGDWHQEPICFKAGDRIAQLVIAPVPSVQIEEVATLDELGTTARGAGGFGSSGK